MESQRTPMNWLHGLEDYFRFTGSLESAKYVRNFLSLQYGEDPYGPLKRLLKIAHAANLNEDDYSIVVHAIVENFKHIINGNFDSMKLHNFMHAAKLIIPDEELIYIMFLFFKHHSGEEDLDAISDAFSRSQIKSKIWLAEELHNLNIKPNNILIMAGWYGQLRLVLEHVMTYDKMRVLEIDRKSCEISDSVFNLNRIDDYRVKSVNADINNLGAYKNGYEWEIENFNTGVKYTEKFLPDLVINTSSEHMTTDWFFTLKFKEMESAPVVAIQSNNLFDIPEHINCVHSIGHMKKIFPMREILYEGELQLQGYKRVMLIGRP